MNGYRLWKIHRAVSLHLLTPQYDLFETRGATKNSSLEHFERSRGKGIYNQIARYIETPVQGTQFFLGNIVYTGKDNTFYDLDVGFEHYKLWIKHKESLTNLILEDLELYSEDSLVGDRPALLDALLAGNILPQTLSAIDQIHPFIHEWIKKDYFGANKFPVIISKLNRLIQYDRSKVTLKIQEKDCEKV